MKWTDTDESADPNGKTSDLYFEEDTDDNWNNSGQEAPIGQRANSRVFFLIVGVVVVAVIAVLLVFLLPGGRESGLRSRISDLEERISALEEKINRFEAIDQKVTRIWEQAKSFEKFKARFDRTEASTSLRMDHLTMSLEALQKKLSTFEKRVNTAAKPTGQIQVRQPASPPSVKYHQVKAGETLFSISRRYGLSVDQLLKLNDMKKNAVIKPGQKLVVGPVSR